MPLISINDDVQLFYHLEKNGGDVVVFLNGSIFNHRQWLPAYVPSFRTLSKKQHDILLYDYQGIGRSTPKEDSFSLNSLASELLGLLDALSLEKVHLFGVSKGTMVSQVFSALHPERVASIGGYGVVNLLVEDREVTRTLFSERLDALQQFKDKFKERINKHNFKPLFRAVYVPALFQKPHSELTFKERLISWIIERKVYPMLENTPIKTLYLLFNYYVNEIVSEIDFYRSCINQLCKLELPILLMNGTADTVTPPKMAQNLVKEIPRARLKLFEGFEHVSPSLKKKQAKKIMEEYVRFLNSSDQGSSV